MARYVRDRRGRFASKGGGGGGGASGGGSSKKKSSRSEKAAVTRAKNNDKQQRLERQGQVSTGPRLASGKGAYSGSKTSRANQAARWQEGGTATGRSARSDGYTSRSLWNKTKATGTTSTTTKKTGILGRGKRKAQDLRVKKPTAKKPTTKKAAAPKSTAKKSTAKKPSTRSKNIAADKRLKSTGMTSAGTRTRTALSKRFSGTAKTKSAAARRWTEENYSRSSQANLSKTKRKSTVRRKKKK